MTHLLRSPKVLLSLVGALAICLWWTGWLTRDGASATAATETRAAIPPLPPCVAIKMGETVEGAISPEYERDVYCLEAAAESRATITMLRKPGTRNEFDPRLYVLGPDVKLIHDPDADDDRGGQRNALIPNVLFRQGGTYRIVATSYEGESEGAYTLSVRAP